MRLIVAVLLLCLVFCEAHKAKKAKKPKARPKSGPKPAGEKVPSKFKMLGKAGDDCPGSDLSHHGVSLEECGQKCLDDARCTGFTYSTDPTAPDLCWPKFRLCVNPGYRVDTSTYILKKVPPVPSKDLPNYTTLDAAGDCPGQDIGGYNLDFKKCAAKCDELSNCVGFVYSTNGRASKPCWPKRTLCGQPRPMAFTGTFKKTA